MKVPTHIFLALAIGLLGAGAFSMHRGSKVAVPHVAHAAPEPLPASTQTPALAAPLLDRAFTSSCLSDPSGFYRETLTFRAQGTTTFVRHYFADAQCTQDNQAETVQEGHYALAKEEAGQLLLMVRHLYNEKTAAVTPYFEALIKVDHNQLVMESSPETTLHYTADTKAI